MENCFHFSFFRRKLLKNLFNANQRFCWRTVIPSVTFSLPILCFHELLDPLAFQFAYKFQSTPFLAIISSLKQPKE